MLFAASAIFAQNRELSQSNFDVQLSETSIIQEGNDEQPSKPAYFPIIPSKEIFDLLFQFDVGVAGGEYAVATDGEYIYTAAWNSENFYKYEMDGTYLHSFTIPGAGHVRDLTFDGQYFYGSPNNSNIYKMDFNNQTLVETINASGVIRGIAYDAINDGFWVTNDWDSPLSLIDRSGNVVETLNTVANVFSGLAWENVTYDTPYLWGYNRPSGTNDQFLVQIDMTTGETVQSFDVATQITLPNPYTASSGGLVITDLAIPGKWAFLGIVQNQVIWGLELADAAPPASPAAPTNLDITVGEMGLLEAELSWDNPDNTVDNNPLTELDAVHIYRNELLIHTINNPVIGASETYLDDNITAAGFYTYEIRGENNAGIGLPISHTEYVGEDVPAAPENILLVADGNNGLITWDAPTSGLNGAYFTGEDLTYTVVRFPGEVEVASAITEQTFTDTEVPGIGDYYYTVTASNPSGDGGTGESNVEHLGFEDILLFETFDEEGVFPPTDWTYVDGGVNSYWQQSSVHYYVGGFSARSLIGGSTNNLADEWLITPLIDMDHPNAQMLTFFGLSAWSPDGKREKIRILAVDQLYDNVDDLHANANLLQTIHLGGQWGEHAVNISSLTGEQHLVFNYYITEDDNATINWVYIDNVTVGQLDGFTLTMEEPVGEGNVSPSVGNHAYLPGAEVTVSATPALGWIFSHWDGNVADENSSNTTILMNSDESLTAHFVEFDGIDLPYTENFDGVASGEMPENWVRDIGNWQVHDSNHAGGEAPELRFHFFPSNNGRFYAYTPKLNTSDYEAISLTFKHHVNNHGGPGQYTLSVVSIADGEEYLIHEWVDPTDVPATELSFILTDDSHGVGADNFFIAWVFDGASLDISQWYIDDIHLEEALEIPDIYEVTFHVMEDSDEEAPIVGATIILNDITYTTDQDGKASVDLEEGTYTASISMSGYTDEQVTFTVDGQDKTVEVHMSDIIEEPYNLQVVTDGMNEGEALFMWNVAATPVFYEGFEEGSMPEDWDQVITNTGINGPIPSTWNVNNHTTTNYGPIGNYHVGMWWDYDHQDEWIISPEISIEADFELKFWSAVFLGSDNADHYYVKVSTDGGDTWDEIWDASAQTGGWNYYDFPIVLDLNDYAGEDVHIAFNAVDGPDNNGLWYVWFVDEISVGTEDAHQRIDITRFNHISKNGNRTYSGEEVYQIARDGTTITMPGTPDRSRVFTGYNVFLNGDMVAEAITDTEFLFTELPEGEHTAGVQSVYTTGTSNVIEIDFLIEIEPDLYAVIFNIEDEEGNPVEDAVITFDSTEYEAGQYIIENVLPGSYDYTVAKEGYYDVSGEVTVVDEDVLTDVTLIEIVELFAVTFNVDLSLAIEYGILEGFETDHHHILLTGTMFNWTEPDPEQEDMVLDWIEETPMIYATTLHLEAGIHEYKYFSNLIGDGWEGGEWPDTTNRIVEVSEDMELHDHFGFTDDEVSASITDPLNLNIYPNPAYTTLNIESETTITNIYIFDILGQLVYSTSAGNKVYQINVGSFDSGVYFIRIITERGVSSRKVQINR